MSNYDIFIQGEGSTDFKLIQVQSDASVQDVIDAAKAEGLQIDEDAPLVFLEDKDEAISLSQKLDAAGIQHRCRVHIHRCRQVTVSINFNGEQISRKFPPAATVKRVKKWAVGKHGFDLTDIDAGEHALQLCHSATRPEEDVHIGALTQCPSCEVCFDLVAKQRVEG